MDVSKRVAAADAQPDDSEPTPERQAELSSGYGANVAAGKASYQDVVIRTRGELSWIIKERGWATELLGVPGTEWVDLRGAILSGAQLPGAWLLSANLSNASFNGADLQGAHLSHANLSHARMVQGTKLRGATLRSANLTGAKLCSVSIYSFGLPAADLTGADLREANLTEANLAGVSLHGADLRAAHMDANTVLNDAILDETTRVADVVWNGVPLTRIEWEHLEKLGDEYYARQATFADGKEKAETLRLEEYQSAARSYGQLAVALRNQGLNEYADRYAYRAQLMRRVVLRRQAFLRDRWNISDWRDLRNWLRQFVLLGQRLSKIVSYIGSLLMGLLAGYGYRPLRTLFWYLGIIFGFAFLYMHFGHVGGHPFQFDEALVFSVTSFHGRGFFPGTLDLKDLVTKLAASEAVFGLFIEVSFIATFTQRYFGK